ncbi:MAG: hypothetical protein L7R84_03970 [Balneolaceae bacterium]|nr:hypothetical protein [Balneolaceae bacterium]
MAKEKSGEDKILQEVLDEMHYLRHKYHSHKLKPEEQTKTNIPRPASLDRFGKKEPVGNISVENRAVLFISELKKSGEKVKSLTIKGEEIKIEI